MFGKSIHGIGTRTKIIGKNCNQNVSLKDQLASYLALISAKSAVVSVCKTSMLAFEKT